MTSIDHVTVEIGAGVANIVIAAGGGTSASAIMVGTASGTEGSRWRIQRSISGFSAPETARAPPAKRASNCPAKRGAKGASKKLGSAPGGETSGNGRARKAWLERLSRPNVN